VRQPRRQHPGLAGACAGQHQDGAVSGLYGPPLFRIEGRKVGGGDRYGSNRPFRKKESRSLIPDLFATTSPGLKGGRSCIARSLD
jgi:hypothetical protein